MKEQQNYELAFHLDPNLEEAKIQELKKQLEDSVTSRSGNVSFSREPEKIHLAYPIQHNGYAFFGYIQFTTETADPSLKEINDELKLNKDILRFLIVKVPSAGQRREAVLKQVKAKEKVEKRVKEQAATPEESKEMEKKLEDILGNL